MIHFLFNRNSKFVIFLEIVAFASLAITLYLHILANRFDTVFFTTNWGIYLFLKGCTFIRWHKGVERTKGIGLHFKKTIVASNYILAISGWLYLPLQQSWILITATILLAIIAHVNFILIYIQVKHNTPYPANFLSDCNNRHNMKPQTPNNK